MPLNTYGGQYFKADALFNVEALGSNQTYQSYSVAYRSYHELSDSVVFAWEVQGCKRGGMAPLWDSCAVKLRGFSATDYLGQVSASAQFEARWRLSKRWGLVGFAGSGYVGNSFRETLIYSVNGYNTDRHLELHGDFLDASTNARRSWIRTFSQANAS